MSKTFIEHGLISDNRRANFEYTIEEQIEAGIVLQGSEVKSLRLGSVSLQDSYVGLKAGELVLYNAHIGPYPAAGKAFNHTPRAVRKILVHNKQKRKLIGQITKDRMTLVALRLYFNARGRCKVMIGVAKGKKLVDKRESIKKREWDRQKQRFSSLKYTNLK